MAVVDIPDLGLAAALSSTDLFVLTQGSAVARRVTLQRLASAIQAISDAASKTPARAATTAALPANTATATTLTANANGAFPAIDGVTLSLDQYALVKNQALPQNNGLYKLTQVGSGVAPWILTRSDDMDTWAEVPGATVVVTEGSTLGDTVWVTTANESGVLGTTAIAWIQLASYSAKTAALASVTWAADKMFRTTSATGVVMDTVTAFARTLLDDANAAAALTTLGASLFGSSIFTGDGQIPFPAAQNASADPNTLDDYEEGDWTPVLTCATPGDLAVAYTTQSGKYTKIGRLVTCLVSLVTSSFTWTTASGEMRVTGLPFTAAGLIGHGALTFAGITKVSYTQYVPNIDAGVARFRILASGSNVAQSVVSAANMPSGGAVTLQGTFSYIV